MATLIYAPEVTVRIRTSPKSKGKGAIIDVSDDISSGSVHRITGGLSTTNLTLINQNRKYDGMFSPMDTIVVYLKRIRKVLKFSGYLDDVPKWSAEPGAINLNASCTMKRLQHFLWDPTTAAGAALLMETVLNAQQMQDGGAAKRAIKVMNEVAGWPLAQIHIARIPENWYDKVSKIADELIAEAEAAQMASAVGSGSWMNGQNPSDSGLSSVTGIGDGTGTLPASRGRVSMFGGPNGGAYGEMALTGESGVNPRDPWYCAMRWDYYPNPNAVDGAKEWWKNRKILVVNPANQKAVVLRAADWGPHTNTGRVLDISPTALKELGAATDDVMHIAFAPEGVNLGPVSTSDADLGGDLATTTAGSATSEPGAITEGWGSPGDERNIVWAKAGGIKFQCHRLAKIKFEGFVNDLIRSGYSPKTVGGYYDRDIANTTRKSNHAWGAAIDIDAATNKYYHSGAGGPHTLPDAPGIVDMARKWGLGWGGEWNNAKDYMHFEVIGAPASDTYDNIGPGAGDNAVVVQKWKPPIRGSYTISSRFGDGGANWSSGTHSGTDFATSEGTPIYPVGPGTVHAKLTGDPSYGNAITIDHGGGNYTFYAHMVATSILATDTPVSSDTVLGAVGETGNATGPHVHVEYRRGADTYTAATQSGGIEKYVLGGVKRADPPTGAQTVEGDYTEIDIDLTSDQMGQGLFNVFQFQQAAISQGGLLFGGTRALLNDEPVMNTIRTLMGVAMRDFCSAPNGDFIAWFPDYFGHFGQAGKMVISTMEIDGVSGPPTIGWTDKTLKTHQFVSGATLGGQNDATSVLRMATTAGVASIEFPELMMALLNISRKEAEELRDFYLNRYGPRVDFSPMENITGARQEFFYACHKFQQNWSEQYQASLTLKFMPELYPGMLACFPEYGIQGYVKSTTDSFDLTDGGSGFSTSIDCSPWSSMGKNANPAAADLPVGAPL